MIRRRTSSDTAKPNLARTLAARASNSSRQSSEKATEEFLLGLHSGEVVDTEGIAGRPIFIIRGPDGTPVGVRKIATTVEPLPGHFTATQKEARIYDILTKFPGWRNHILPIRSVKTAEDTVVIDFDWLEGEDTSSYLDKHPSEFLQIMRQILMQLRWLALHDYAHGDIKLDNFYRDSEGRILLFDFGRTRKIMYTGIAAELAAIARIIRPYNEALGSWILTTAIDEYDASKPPKDNLAEFYLTIVSKLTPSRTSRKSSSNTRRRSSNSKNGGGRKSRKSSSGSRPH